MQFQQNLSDGSCKIKFSWRERWILFTKGALYMEPQTFRHFSNNLIKIVADWTAKMDPDVKKMYSTGDEPIQVK